MSEELTLKDIGMTYYEFNNGDTRASARWYWDPRFIPPLKEQEGPLDITTLTEIDMALARASYIARWKAHIRRRYKRA